MSIFVGAGTSSFMHGSGGVGVSTMTTTQRDALSGVENGTFIYNTTISLMQYWDGSAWKTIDSPPTITTIEVDGRAATTSEAVDDSAGGNVSVVINGSNFDTTAGEVIFEASSGSNVTPNSIIRNNTSKFTVTAARSDFLEANDPYAIKVTNGSGLSATLANAIDVNRPPTFATAADTNIGFVYNTLSNFSSLTTVASTDPESDTITHTLASGTLPNGMSLQTNGTFTGTCSGLPASVTEYTFTVQAATAAWTITRQFKIDAAENAYTQATGGTITTDGDYKIHTFNSSGNFVVSTVGTGTNGDKVRQLVGAGGGGGGTAQSNNEGNHTSSGGGGAGGMRFNSAYDHTITTTTYAITVGGGGSAASGSNVRANSGSDSTFHNINSDGGGYGGDSHTTVHADSGGSGGGAGTDFDSPPTAGNGGTGNHPNTSPAQGNPGGNANLDQQSGGGGGAGQSGGAGSGTNQGAGGNGGDGLQNDITGTNTYYAGGGGGGAYDSSPSKAGTGGQGGGGQCGTNTGGANGGTNLGGGGGGVNQNNGYGGASGSGGSGVVIIRYKYQ